MENKKLNISAIKSKMQELGLNQSDIAENLQSSREIISQWLKGEKFPKPKNLLNLAQFLNLKFEQIVIKESYLEPVVAFRKKAQSKTTQSDFERAKDMGELLRLLVPFLPYPKLTRPASLANPKLDYYYIQEAAYEIRNKITHTDYLIEFTSLIDFFSDMHATIIPVLWGPRGGHENALHIYLPDSMTTWIFLNLDTSIIDFKFWMAHELGHVKSPDLRGEEAEDFADQFASALLFPEEIARTTYSEFSLIHDKGHLINKIKGLASELIISPITILKGLNDYATEMNLPQISVDIFPAAKNFYKDHKTVSEIIFESSNTNAELYIKKVEDIFHTCFFEALKGYLEKENKKEGFVQRILDVPVTDAEEIYRYLIHAAK